MIKYFFLCIAIIFGTQHCADHGIKIVHLPDDALDNALATRPRRPPAKGKTARAVADAPKRAEPEAAADGPARPLDAETFAFDATRATADVQTSAEPQAAAAQVRPRDATQATQRVAAFYAPAVDGSQPITLDSLNKNIDDKAIEQYANKTYESAWFAKEHRTAKYIKNFKELPNQLQAVLMRPELLEKLSPTDLEKLLTTVDQHESIQIGKDGGTFYSGERSGTLVDQLTRLSFKIKTLAIDKTNAQKIHDSLFQTLSPKTQGLAKDPTSKTLKTLNSKDLTTVQSEIREKLKSLNGDSRIGAKQLHQELTALQKKVADRQAVLKRQETRNAVDSTSMDDYMKAEDPARVRDPKAEIIQRQINEVATIQPQTAETREEIAQLKQELANYHTDQHRKAGKNAENYTDAERANTMNHSTAKTAADRTKFTAQGQQILESIKKANAVTRALGQRARAAQAAAA